MGWRFFRDAFASRSLIHGLAFMGWPFIHGLAIHSWACPQLNPRRIRPRRLAGTIPAARRRRRTTRRRTSLVRREPPTRACRVPHTHSHVCADVRMWRAGEGSRLAQLVEWCGGEGFEGLLVLDECHKCVSVYARVRAACRVSCVTNTRTCCTGHGLHAAVSTRSATARGARWWPYARACAAERHRSQRPRPTPLLCSDWRVLKAYCLTSLTRTDVLSCFAPVWPSGPRTACRVPARRPRATSAPARRARPRGWGCLGVRVCMCVCVCACACACELVRVADRLHDSWPEQHATAKPGSLHGKNPTQPARHGPPRPRTNSTPR
jgi:hypothetical protein